MSYKCDFCERPTPNGTTMRTVVTETRRREYQHPHIDFTIGSEIVKEQKICETCYGSARDQEDHVS